MARRWTTVIAMLVIPALLLLSCPGTCGAGEFSDNSSQGAAITVGLFATVLVVLFLVNLKTDVDHVIGKAPQKDPRLQDEALARRVSLVLEPPHTSPTEHNLQDPAMELASGVNVGLRVQF